VEAEMKYQNIFNTPLMVSQIGLGCMRLSKDPREAVLSIRTAFDEGINFFDHANIYGRGRCEAVFSEIWSEVPGLREKIILQSKCGIRFSGDPNELSPKRYDFSQEHILSSVNDSLKRLKTDYLDLYLLHRPDSLCEPEEVASAFSILKKAGKVRFFGVSNFSAVQIELLKKAVAEPLVVNQIELSLLHNYLIDSGVLVNQVGASWAALPGDGVLEYCQLKDITVQAWGPLANGAITGKLSEYPNDRTRQTAGLVAILAEEKQVGREAIPVAWLLRHPAKIQVIIGTTNPDRIKTCCRAVDLELTREEWYRLLTASRGSELP
jgi:predicted oxidoreductase